MDDREAAEDDVAEEMLAQMPDRRHHPAHADRGADLLGLSGAGRAGADHFLQRDDVGVQLADHLGHARRHRPAIHPAAAMDVVGRDPHVDVSPGGFQVAHGFEGSPARGAPHAGRGGETQVENTLLERLEAERRPGRAQSVEHGNTERIALVEVD